jgi:hypothetical protein
MNAKPTCAVFSAVLIACRVMNPEWRAEAEIMRATILEIREKNSGEF